MTCFDRRSCILSLLKNNNVSRGSVALEEPLSAVAMRMAPYKLTVTISIDNVFNTGDNDAQYVVANRVNSE